MVLYENPFVKLDYSEAESLLVQRWTGFATSGAFREGIDKTLELVKDKGVKRIVSDTRSQSVVKAEDAEYATAAMPKLFLSGMKAMAFVLPTSVFTKMSLNKFADNNPMKNDGTQFFDNFNEAVTWVKSK